MVVLSNYFDCIIYNVDYCCLLLHQIVVLDIIFYKFN